jgi:DNA ligase (NAD+)
MSRVQELEKLILHHKEVYYRGKAEISDEAFDQLEAELKKLDPENPVLSLVGHQLSDPAGKVSHQRRMLSLEKTYDENSLVKWIGEEEVLSVLKIDGSSCSLIYEQGKLVMAKTRGDGQFGENVTRKAFFIPDIPKRIPFQGYLEVRGEIFCLEANFFVLSKIMQEMGLEKPSSQRNIVAGLLGRKENVQLASHLSFKAFDLISEVKFKHEAEKVSELKRLGFDLPDFELHRPGKSLAKRIAEAKDFMAKGDYLIDGLVFVYNDLRLHEELGETSHHPRYKLAFKFQGETKVTVIKDIEWGVSRNGLLTPVALVEPVELSGAMIGRVTLHNFGLVQNFELKSGDKIEIIRSGEVIPKFLGIVEKANGGFSFPEECPSCCSRLRVQDIWLMCENPVCPAKVREEILNYIHKSGVEDLSDRRLEELMQKGLVEQVPDLYRLRVEDFLLLDKVKDKLANKMFENIQKSKQQTLVQFISAIGLEGISTAKTEKIIAHGHNTLEKFLQLSLDKILAIEGFAEKSGQVMLRSLELKKPLIEELLAVGVIVKSDEIMTGEGPLKGLKFCITGELSAPRTEIERQIKLSGGIMVGSVSKNTNYLVTNETESSSSKFVKAKSLGVPIISEAQLQALLQG